MWLGIYTYRFLFLFFSSVAFAVCAHNDGRRKKKNKDGKEKKEQGPKQPTSHQKSYCAVFSFPSFSLRRTLHTLSKDWYSYYSLSRMGVVSMYKKRTAQLMYFLVWCILIRPYMNSINNKENRIMSMWMRVYTQSCLKCRRNQIYQHDIKGDKYRLQIMLW